MPAIDDFQGRVDYAASVIAAGRSTSRAFDGCFENYDGDAVAAALVRRSQGNERLSANLWRYLCQQSATEAAARLEGQHLPTVALAMREAAQLRYA